MCKKYILVSATYQLSLSKLHLGIQEKLFYFSSPVHAQTKKTSVLLASKCSHFKHNAAVREIKTEVIC